MKADSSTAVVEQGGKAPGAALMRAATPSDLARWMIWPAVVFTIAFFVVPLIIMVLASFWVRSGGTLVADWTLQNYVKFFTRDYLLTALRNSIEVSVLTTALSVILAYPLAYVLAFHVPERWQKIVLVVAVLPFWTSYVVRSYSWLLVIGDKGILNNFLLSLGLISEPLKLAYTRSATVLGFVHFFVMLLTLTIYANLIQISPSYVKAAQDLGASTLGVIWHVILPLSLPGVAVGAFLTFVITIGDYVTPQILGGNTEVLVPQAIMLQIVRTADLPMAATLSLVLMILVDGRVSWCSNVISEWIACDATAFAGNARVVAPVCNAVVHLSAGCGARAFLFPGQQPAGAALRWAEPRMVPARIRERSLDQVARQFLDRRCRILGGRNPAWISGGLQPVPRSNRGPRPWCACCSSRRLPCQI